MHEILVDEKIKKSYFWNTLAGLLNSFQLVILLLIVSRTNELGDSGILSSAYALGNLFMAFEKFGMRNFQISDTCNKYSQNIYYLSRIITNGMTVLIFTSYGFSLFFNGSYTWNKLIVMLIICFLKTLDAYEDVIHGTLQHNGHFDIASRALAIRLLLTLLLQGGLLLVTHNLVFSFGSSLFVSIFLYYLLTSRYIQLDIQYNKENWIKTLKLIKECMPLGISAFTIMYVSNFPKYVIDAYLNNEIQACFNYIFMPVFVINLMTSFVFLPILTKVSAIWGNREIGKFIKIIFQEFIITLVIILFTIMAGVGIGIPVLSFVFNRSLEQYKKEFVILLISGGFLAMQMLYSLLLTIMREQKYILYTNVIVLITAIMFQKIIVIRYGTVGISLFYMGVIAFLSILQLLKIVKIIAQEMKSDEWRK